MIYKQLILLCFLAISHHSTVASDAPRIIKGVTPCAASSGVNPTKPPTSGITERCWRLEITPDKRQPHPGWPDRRGYHYPCAPNGDANMYRAP